MMDWEWAWFILEKGEGAWAEATGKYVEIKIFAGSTMYFIYNLITTF